MKQDNKLRLAWKTKSETDSEPLKVIHATKDHKNTLCGYKFANNSNWFLWITGNNYEVTCKKCLRLIKNEKI